MALFFLVVDLLEGQPLFTPSLMGSVVFYGMAAETVSEVRPDAVAYFSLLHIVSFVALGAAISWLVHEVELRSQHPVVVLLVLFAVIEAAFFVVAPVALSGVIDRLGMVRLAGANLLAAGSMALFFALYHRAEAWEELKHTTGELVRDALYAGALGGSAVALFFLVVDLADGRPLFTPSLIGSVIFHGMAAEAVSEVRPDAVVYFSLAHIASFLVLGAAISWLVHEVELRSRHPVVVLLVLFAVIEAAFFLVASLALPGVIERLGIVRVGVANLLAAGSMALHFALCHRKEAWEKLKHTTADLVFDSFYSGAIGGSVVALFFFVTDSLHGEPLLTPSLMGSVIFQGAAAHEVTEVQLNAVAYYSLVHIVSFAALGALVSWLVHEVELRAQHPVVVLLVVFSILEATFFLVASLAVPGVIDRLGVVRVGVANLLAAGSMALFFVASLGSSEAGAPAHYQQQGSLYALRKGIVRRLRRRNPVLREP